MDDFNAVEKYLLRGEYPDNFTKAEKANLRRRCRNNFQLADGVMKYRTAMKPGKWRVCNHMYAAHQLLKRQFPPRARFPVNPTDSSDWLCFFCRGRRMHRVLW